MYVRMYVPTYVYTYACMYVRMHVRMYVCMNVHTYVFMYVCAYVRMYVCMYVCMNVCMLSIKYSASQRLLPSLYIVLLAFSSLLLYPGCSLSIYLLVCLPFSFLLESTPDLVSNFCCLHFFGPLITSVLIPTCKTEQGLVISHSTFGYARGTEHCSFDGTGIDKFPSHLAAASHLAMTI
jgi:hypothetical protein